jgi:hypothetical protein
MSEITKDMQKNLDAFNNKNQKVLQKTAKELLAQGIARVHYGVDYVNDDGDAADYAVLEYTDGRIEEQDEWLEALDYETFGFGMTYCLPYTFDAREATVLFDLEGGSMDAEESVIRMYHTPERREKLEAEYEENNLELDLVSYTNRDELSAMSETFQARGITQVFFGVDCIDETYTLSDWGVLVFDDETEQLLDYCPKELEAIQDVIDELPQFGAFVFNVETCMIEVDFEGGIFEVNDTESRVYHTQDQLAALEARVTK